MPPSSFMNRLILDTTIGYFKDFIFFCPQRRDNFADYIFSSGKTPVKPIKLAEKDKISGNIPVKSNKTVLATVITNS